MVDLTPLHFVYFFIVLVVIITMAFKKDTVLPCILGIFLVGFMYSGSIVKGIQAVYNALIAAGNEFWSIILVISLVVAMSRALRDIGADELMMLPIKKLMINPTKCHFFCTWICHALFFLVYLAFSCSSVGRRHHASSGSKIRTPSHLGRGCYEYLWSWDRFIRRLFYSRSSCHYS